MKKLTPKQEMFCKEYIIDFNATRAAIAAGYSKKTASETGYENLRKPQIIEHINKLSKKHTDKLEITVDRVLQEYARIAFLDPAELVDESGNLLPLHELPEDVRRAVGGLDIVSSYNKNTEERETKHRLKILDKGKALESLSRYLGLYEADNTQKSSVGEALLEKLINEARATGLPSHDENDAFFEDLEAEQFISH